MNTELNEILIKLILNIDKMKIISTQWNEENMWIRIKFSSYIVGSQIKSKTDKKIKKQ